MGGLLPKRREGWSGLYPVPGWQSANDWLGFVEPESMPEAFNPEEGYLASANQDVSALCQTPLQSCPINDYRYRRICQLLETKDELDLEDMKAIQLDVHSLRADRLVPLLASALPDGAARARLLAWDREVTVDSRTATLFDALYQRALVAIFCGGEGAIPEAMFRHLQKETPVGFELDVFFERVLLSETSIWFGERTREQILQGAFAGIDTQDWPRWGEQNRIVMENIFFGGRLPRLLGVDRGPFEMPGSPDTPRQGTLFRDAGRATSFCPSQRFLTDLGKHEAWTVIPGGPSEKRFSGRYLTDVEAWLKGGYKLLRA